MNKAIEELRDLNLKLESLNARKAALKKLAAEHRDSITDAEILSATEEARSLKTEIETVQAQIKDAQERAEIENTNKGDFKLMENKVENRSSIEYRKAFMDYIQRGVDSEILEKRSNEYTTTTTAATVIPQTVMDEIIKQSKISGNILSKVRKMNVKGGVKFATISVLPAASWIDEDTPSERKKLSTGSVTFSYYGLEVKIAQSLLSEYVSIDAFEKEFAQLAVEAMTNAKEIAIFNGTGSGQPTGIFTDSNVTAVTLSAADLVKYDKLRAAFGKLPVSYQAGAEWAMAQGTWDKIDGMVDINGQPVSRTNYGIDGDVKYYLFGKLVNIVETDRIKDVDTASSTEFYIALGQFNKYAINSNGNLGVYKYRDEDANQDVTKALEFCDGKVLDAKAFIKIKKGS